MSIATRIVFSYSPESYSQPVGVVYGNCSGRSRFFSRSSAGSIFSSAARQSTIRSMTYTASVMRNEQA